MIAHNVEPLKQESRTPEPQQEEIEDNYENEFNEEIKEKEDNQFHNESERLKEPESGDWLGVQDEKFEIHDSDVGKDKEEIYQNKLEKIEKEDEDKYDFDLPDNFGSKNEENYTEPKEEIEENSEIHISIQNNSEKEFEKSVEKSVEKSDEIEDKYDEEFEQNPTHESKHSHSPKSENDEIDSEINIHDKKGHEMSDSDIEEEKEVIDDVQSKDTKK